MTVLGLNHVNIRTTDLAATLRFYTGILGFKHYDGKEMNGFPRNWLLDSRNEPIIHLRELSPDAPSCGPIDHVALNCDDMAEVLARLEREKIPFAKIDTVLNGITQVFLKDPNGVPLELNFATPK
jgi:catechol 2,3-dioxygenase-like lactoylglutathione lyase family enzyme